MGRFAFENFPGEPEGMRGAYTAMDSDMLAYTNAAPHVVPAALQTEDYMLASLLTCNGSELAAQRVQNRQQRNGLFIESGIPQLALLTATGLEFDMCDDKELALAQIEHVAATIEQQMTEGDSPLVKVQIVPHEHEPTLFSTVKSRADLHIGKVVSNAGIYIYGADSFEVDKVDDTLRGREARRRESLLHLAWFPNAVEGENALRVVERSLRTVLTR